MLTNASLRLAAVLCAFLLFAPRARSQDGGKTGEVRFTGDTQEERDAGVWIDGKYAGYVNELKGDRKMMLSPGEHEISIREAGYKDLDKKIVVAAGEAQTIAVVLETNPTEIFPGANAVDVRLDVQPKRAAVFVDGGYLGHGGDFGGRFHSMQVSPGKHRIRVELNGYKPYETDITVVENEKSRMKITLEKDSGGPAPPPETPSK